jgi:hypothetical protein
MSPFSAFQSRCTQCHAITAVVNCLICTSLSPDVLSVLDQLQLRHNGDASSSAFAAAGINGAVRLGSAGPNKSRYRGVSYDKKKRKWRVQIKVCMEADQGYISLLLLPRGMTPKEMLVLQHCTNACPDIRMSLKCLSNPLW